MMRLLQLALLAFAASFALTLLFTTPDDLPYTHVRWTLDPQPRFTLIEIAK